MRDDLLKMIEAQADVRSVIILCHNIDFVFVQSMVLRALRRCGNPNLTIFADFHCATESFAQQSEVLDSIGVRYRVVPVKVESGYRFHPKAIFLSGSRKGTLFVGSGNMTYGGWRDNGEVWAHYDSEEDGLGSFVAFREYVRAVVPLVPLNKSLNAEVEEAFDARTRKWLEPNGGRSDLLGWISDQQSLIEQVAEQVPTSGLRSLTVCAPYYDHRAKALRDLMELFGPSNTQVFCQSGKCNLPKSAFSRIKDRVDLRSVELRKPESNKEDRSRFLHAKFYAFESADDVVVVVGSANCSRAALKGTGREGNAELVTIHKLSRSRYKAEFLNDLDFPKEQPILGEEVADPDEVPYEEAPLRLHAARFDGGSVLLGYVRHADVRLTDCLADGAAQAVQDLGDGCARILANTVPRTVTLRGKVRSQVISSNLIWVDNERELRSTSTARTLGDAIRKNVQPENWGLPAYAEILRALNRHLEYVPSRQAVGIAGHGTEAAENIEFEESDVFSETYGLPGLGSSRIHALTDNPVHSLRKLLLRWFGLQVESEPEETESNVGDTGDIEMPDEEDVDHPLPLPKPSDGDEKDRKDGEEYEKRGVRKLTEKIAEAMSARSYLEFREPDLLATDLKVVALLLRIGLKEKWLTMTEFLECTHRVWTSWFFTSEICATKGWLEYRFGTDPSPQAFVASMKSTELSAALAAWAQSSGEEIKTPGEARLALSCVLSVARLPWLWRGGTTRAIATELTSLLVQTADEKTTDKAFWERFEGIWLQLMRWGSALRRLETVLEGHTPAQLAGKIRQDEIAAGELLWQGQSGFCVASESCQRSQKQSVHVLHLQGTTNKPFRSEYLIPLRGLLEDGVIPLSKQFGNRQRKEIAALVSELSEGFKSV